MHCGRGGCTHVGEVWQGVDGMPEVQQFWRGEDAKMPEDYDNEGQDTEGYYDSEDTDDEMPGCSWVDLERERVGESPPIRTKVTHALRCCWTLHWLRLRIAGAALRVMDRRAGNGRSEEHVDARVTVPGRAW